MTHEESYKILGLPPGADVYAIQTAYYQLATELGPRVSQPGADPAAEARLRQLAEAVDALSRPDTRVVTPPLMERIQANLPYVMAAGAGLLTAVVMRAAVLIFSGSDSVEAAQQAEMAGDLDKAIHLYEQALADSSGDDEIAVRRMLMGIYEKKGASEQAVEQARVLSASPSVSVEDLIHLATLEQAAASPAGARDAWEKVATSEGATPTQRLNAGIRLQDLGHFETAATTFEQLEKVPELITRARACRVDLLAAQGRYEDAQIMIDDALTRDPASPELLVAQGRLALARGKLMEADGIFQKALEADGSFAPALVGKAEVFIRQQQRSSAAPLMKKAAELAATDLEIQIAYAYFLIGDGIRGREATVEPARAQCTRVSKISPGHGYVFSCEGLVQLTLGDIPRGTKLLERARVVAPGLLKVTLDLAVAYRLAGDLQRGMTLLEEVRSQFPGRYELLLAIGRSALRLDDPATAGQMAEQVLSREPNYVPGLLLQAEVARRAGDGKGAQAGYEHILTLEPSSVEAHFGLAELALKRNDGRVARTELDTIVAQQPNDPSVYLRLAAIEAVEDNDSVAVDHLHKALALGAPVEEVAEDPSFESLADYAPFKALLAEYHP